MIKNKTIILKVTGGIKKVYSNLGYDFSSSEVEIKIEDLSKSSQIRIDVICDLCFKQHNMIYAKYNKNLNNNNGIFSCKECFLKRRKDEFTYNNLSLNDEVQKKKKETFIKNYGVDNPSKSDFIKNKKKETCNRNYGVDCGLMLKDLKKEGMIKKYGVEYPSQSVEIREKIKKTLIDNYGDDNISKIESVKKSKILTCLKNHGTTNPFVNELIKQKINKTNLEKYGSIYPIQNRLIFNKQLKSAFKIIMYNDILFSQGTYELDFLNFCEKNNIINLISNGPSINYTIDALNTSHIYHSDFFIEKYNLIIEIKSNYTYEAELEKNLMKEKYSKLAGFDFLFIIDKKYDDFINYLSIKNQII